MIPEKPKGERSLLASADTGGVAPLHEGFLVADKYGLIEPLGTGSMGTVWKASHVMLGHTVAIKFLHASIEAYPEGRTRFEREAKLSARLGEASRHICRVTDFGVFGSGTPFVVMELLQGEELSTCLRRERQLSLPVIVEIVTQLCRALSVAHAAGVIHRDLKPANVFLCKAEEGQEVLVKLLDFGVAKAALEHEDTQATRAGTIFGTPGYMSPEQIVADTELDPRSDLWSVAVMAYRMAVGRTPFGSGGLGELGLRILSTNPAAPSTVRPELPRRFDEWMKKALAKRREDRFDTATELAAALAEATGTRASEPPPNEMGALPERISGIEDLTTYKAVYRSEAAPGPIKPSRTYLVPAIALGALAAGAIAILSTRHPQQAAAASTPAASAPLTETAAMMHQEAPTGDGQNAPSTANDPRPFAPPVPAVAAGTETSALPVASASVALHPRNPAPHAVRPAPAPGPGAVAKRAGELWNKKDEL